MTEREILTKKLSSYQFAIADMKLYLDTHPNDSETIKKIKEYSEKLKTMRKSYEEIYGPLTMNDISGNRWKWIKSPWPWETEEAD